MEFEEAATFPQVSINNKAIGGCKETLKFLQEQKMI
jgi:glutaredoxin-related protein